VDEHPHHLLVLGEVGMDDLDHDRARDARSAVALGEEQRGHAARAHAAADLVLAEPVALAERVARGHWGSISRLGNGSRIARAENWVYPQALPSSQVPSGEHRSAAHARGAALVTPIVAWLPLARSVLGLAAVIER